MCSAVSQLTISQFHLPQTHTSSVITQLFWCQKSAENIYLYFQCFISKQTTKHSGNGENLILAQQLHIHINLIF